LPASVLQALILLRAATLSATPVIRTATLAPPTIHSTRWEGASASGSAGLRA
jgi:hypothetical protein